MRHSAIPTSARCDAIDICFAGATVTAWFELDREEHERRQRLECGSVLDRQLLEVLGALPHGLAVPWLEIDPLQRTLLDTAPPGIVEASQGSVRRLWRPAVHLLAVTRRSRRWRRDLEAVSLFAPDAARYLIVDRTPNADQPVVEHARWLGVGIALAESGEVVLPAEDLLVAPTPRHWRLLETIYEAALAVRSEDSDVA